MGTELTKVTFPDTNYIDLDSRVSNVAWDSTNKKLTQTFGETTTDIVTGKTILEPLIPVKTTEGSLVSFSDGADLPIPSFICNIDAVQDLHGYDAPWVGGAGKNKLPLTVESIKTASDKNTWNNNSITINGVTYEIQVDTNGNVLGIKTNGTASGDSYLRIYDGGADFHGKLLNGCPSNGSINTYYMQFSNVSVGSDYDLGNGTVINQTDTGRWILIINIKSGTTVSNLVFKPMIRLSTVSDSTFAPYSNICPISGWTACNVTRSGANLFDKTTITENKIINNNTGEEITSYGRFSSDYIKVNSSTDYYASNVIKSAQWYCAFYYDKNKNYLSCGELSSTGDTASGVITTPSNCNYVRLVGVTTYKDDVSFVAGNQAPTSYEPYNGQTYTIDLDGTRYGGTLDVVSGVLTVEKASIKLSDLIWTKQNTVNNNWRFKSSPSIQNIKIPTNAAYKIDNLCSVYRNVTANETWTADDTGIAINADASLLICDLNQADTTALGVVIANQTICYELATPLTIQLTPTQVKSLLGNNNAWCDTGDVNVKYTTQSYDGISAKYSEYAYNAVHATSGVTAGTYQSVTVDTYGHVTAGSNPTTISGYGITDAKIENDTITLGNNTLTTVPVQNNAGYHNSIYRGKSLGTSITAEQWASISAGTFEDMYIGDYWTLSTTIGGTTSNVQYVIAAFDYWWNCGDSYPQSSNKHHIVLVPASILYSAKMNDSNITTGGYVGSKMYTDYLANARTGISTLFGDHLYSVRRLFVKTVNAAGQGTAWNWYTSSVDLMNETMVYGHPVWTTSGFEVGVDRTILPLFALNPASASIRSFWWLRCAAASAFFAFVRADGYASCGGASASFGVRPAFAIY